MSLRRTTYDVGAMLGAFRVPYNVTSVIKNITTQYVIDDFGVVISVINPGDYGMINERLDTVFKGHRKVFVSSNDDLNEKRYEIIWSLMKSGYMKWLRYTYPTHFPNIVDTDNLGGRIIDERIARWGNTPKYRYLVADSIAAKSLGFRQLLSRDPSFFDYMP